MGFAIMLGSCVNCRQPFAFNPHKVPSIRIEGERQPVCQNCMNRLNAMREAAGLAPFPINPDAYDPIMEEELWLTPS